MTAVETNTTDPNERIASEALAELIEGHERVAWRAVPGVSTAEAAAWTERLAEARARLEGDA